MTREEFVKGISVAVQESTVRQVVNKLKGLGYGPPDIALVAWYESLSAHDRDQMLEIVRYAVNSTLFGFFCVVDGERGWEEGPDLGELQLLYSNSECGIEVNLSGPGGEDLHDIFRDYMTAK